MNAPIRTQIARFVSCQVSVPAKRPDKENIRQKPEKKVEGTDILIPERLQWPVFGAEAAIVNFYAYDMKMGEKGVADVEVYEKVKDGRVYRYVDFHKCPEGTEATHRCTVVNRGQYRDGDLDLGNSMFLRIAEPEKPLEKRTYMCTCGCGQSEERVGPYHEERMGPYIRRACRERMKKADATAAIGHVFDGDEAPKHHRPFDRFRRDGRAHIARGSAKAG